MSDYFTELATALDQIDLAELAPLRTFVAECEGTLYVAGNGGSYAIALHWACDLQKAAGRRVVALGANASLATAWANDEFFQDMFARELLQLHRPGDRLLCLSCSGTSPNVSQALDDAHAAGIPYALVTSRVYQGNGALLRVPATDYGVIEDVFSALGHWLTKELQ